MPAFLAAAEVRAVSLDLWGTLIRSDPRFKPARTRLLADAFGVPQTRLDDADKLFRDVDRACDDVAETRGTDVGFSERVLAMASAAVQAGLATDAAHQGELGTGGGYPPSGTEMRMDAAVLSQLSDAQDDLVRRFPPLPFNDAVPELLTRVGAVMPLAIASNTGMLGGATMRMALAANGLLPAFRLAIFSNEIGTSKPSQRFFSSIHAGLDALLEADLEAGQVQHVGDNPRADQAGASAAGMQAVMVNTAPEGHSPRETQGITEVLAALLDHDLAQRTLQR